MRQPGAEAREFHADGGGAGIQGLRPQQDEPNRAGVPASRAKSKGNPAWPSSETAAPGTTRHRNGRQVGEERIPPGQYVQSNMPVLHYGPVPACNPQAWDLRVYGATRGERERRWTWDGFRALPRAEIIADFHCVTKFTVLGVTWAGVPAGEVLRAVPPSQRATHVMIWADFGYGANLPLDAFGAPDTLLATQRDGKELTPQQGYPVRLVVPSRYGWKNVKWVRAIEYMIGDRRGFWEERGYHNIADPWSEQRYSYQEMPGEGPAL
ncbi:MAG: molybdopterin-dependent oxidoreductase [Streptosporangiaceae bacterium]